MKSGNVLLAVLAGIATGALMGILLAPEKGSDLRKKISTAKDDVVDDLKNKFSEFLEDINDKFEAVKDEALDMVENGKSKYTEVRGKMEEARTAFNK